MKEKITVTPRQAEDLFGLNRGSLANLRYQKRGPRYIKKGKKVFYFITDLTRWLKEGMVLTVDQQGEGEVND